MISKVAKTLKPWMQGQSASGVPCPDLVSSNVKNKQDCRDSDHNLDCRIARFIKLICSAWNDGGIIL